MYNRYIPQPDGSYRRNQVPDSPNYPQRPTPRREPAPPTQPFQQPQPAQEEIKPEDPPCQKGQPCAHMRQPRPYYQVPPQQTRPSQQKDTGIFTFLRQLLPKNFDTEDLLIVLLLLLMSGDCAEDQNTALLTLAIYLFL